MTVDVTARVMKEENMNDLTYDEAISEAEEILSRLENEKLPIDRVLEMSKRAAGLIKHCQGKISEIGGEVDKILESLRADTTAAPSNPRDTDQEEF